MPPEDIVIIVILGAQETVQTIPNVHRGFVVDQHHHALCDQLVPKTAVFDLLTQLGRRRHIDHPRRYHTVQR